MGCGIPSPDVGNPPDDWQYHSSRHPGPKAPGSNSISPASMNCSDLVAQLTDYLDGRTSEAEGEAIEAHLAGCSSCVRYKNVVEHGPELLRSLPAPELREDFRPRLKHRLYHVDDERVLAAHAASGTPALTVVGIAILLTTVAWSPTLFSGAPSVELPPIVVNREPTRLPVQPANGTPPGTFSSKSDDGDLDEGLWANTLLYDYSPLSRRYDQRARGRQAGIFDR